MAGGHKGKQKEGVIEIWILLVDLKPAQDTVKAGTKAPRKVQWVVTFSLKRK